ncbi:hypothetical protein K432DRAFT_78871 [Lepidopterella palustris CBS 459.81]|uniref:Uncharacterized protein n=1 Tax=Lepidopterella palustris CBS 459.81 TaxID=1314670 RepID=A0A8E2JDV9_9PEZI|nr:hypothetical protein K432DRAFT_78871 [Lepidopterella palustris CBS 459.81]
MLALSTHIASSLRACSKLRVSPSAPCRVLFSRHPSFQTATRHFSRTPIRQEDLPREQYRSSNSSKPIYPSRLLIYHAGTQKTTFISFWKVTSFFLFGISCGLLAPRFFYAHDESQPVLKAIGVMCLGAIPLLILGVATAPFVNSISLHIPQHARRSRKGLMQLLE